MAQAPALRRARQVRTCEAVRRSASLCKRQLAASTAVVVYAVQHCGTVMPHELLASVWV